MSLLDYLLIPVIVFVAVLFLVASYIIVDKVSDTNVFSSDATAQATVDRTKSTLVSMDTMILFLLMGLSLYVIISSYFVWNHPAFFFIGVFIMIVIIVICVVLSNTHETFIGNTEINETASKFPKINFVMGKLPFYIVFLMFITAIVTYLGYRQQ